jgi:hypothetical protein
MPPHPAQDENRKPRRTRSEFRFLWSAPLIVPPLDGRAALAPRDSDSRQLPDVSPKPSAGFPPPPVTRRRPRAVPGNPWDRNASRPRPLRSLAQRDCGGCPNSSLGATLGCSSSTWSQPEPAGLLRSAGGDCSASGLNDCAHEVIDSLHRLGTSEDLETREVREPHEQCPTARGLISGNGVPDVAPPDGPCLRCVAEARASLL